jgi:hypothetical protein
MGHASDRMAAASAEAAKTGLGAVSTVIGSSLLTHQISGPLTGGSDASLR